MRRPRRTTIKFSTTALAVLLLMLWLGSVWGYVGLCLDPTIDIGIVDGNVYLTWERPWSIWPRTAEVSSGWNYNERSTLRHPGAWWFWWASGPTRDGNHFTQVGIPLWVLWAPAAIASGILWYRDRRRAPGHCPTCNYDLRGNTTGICPECGHD